MLYHVMVGVSDFQRALAFYTPVLAALDMHAPALAGGGRCEGLPGLRPEYHPHYYGAYFRDPDGNKLCVA